MPHRLFKLIDIQGMVVYEINILFRKQTVLLNIQRNILLQFCQPVTKVEMKALCKKWVYIKVAHYT